MKKYFSKYLPIDGEIKEGDMFFFEGSTLPIQKNEFREKQYPLSCDKDPKQKVKLFLCSKDIQLGDTYYHDEYCPYPKGEVADSNTKVMNAHMMIANEGENYTGDESFKVIGEISPEATWVKEGDTFDEGEITFTYINKHFPDEQAEFDNPSEFLANEYYHRNRDKFKMIVKVKCSQCNTYH